MCKENCKCNGEQIEAVRRKIEQMTESALDRLQEAVAKTEVDIKGKTAEINATLFDGITKEELVAGIVNEYDELSLEGLYDREDVQEAIRQSEKLKMEGFNHAMEIGGKLHSCEMQINELATSIMDDVLIFGVNDATKLSISTFNAKVDRILSTIE
jgi:hypothetical protein